MPDTTEVNPWLFQGSATLLVGPPGSGKTASLVTYVEAGLKLAVIFTEPNGPESLLAELDRRGLPVDNVHWAYVAPAMPSWDTMIKNANLINKLDFEGLSGLKKGPGREEYRQFIALLEQLSNFTCARTGECFGPVDELDETWAFALDSLSGLNIMAKQLVVCGKPTCAKGEWGVAMDNEEMLINRLCYSTQCFFALTAHLEREPNELTGIPKLMPGALGQKLSPKIPRFFSDIVHVYREEDQFFWSTASPNVDLKFRLLPVGNKLDTSFVPIVTTWRERKEQAESAMPPPVASARATPALAASKA